MQYHYQLSIQYIIIYLQYVQQKLFKEEINASGEPTSQVITNWDATRGTPLGQRGATRDKSPGTEVKIGSTLAKNSNEKRKNTSKLQYHIYIHSPPEKRIYL